MKLAYPALFEPQPEGGFTVTFLDFPEAITEGDTFEQAYNNAAECLNLVLEVRIEQDGYLPLPSQVPLGHFYRRSGFLSSVEWQAVIEEINNNDAEKR
jgi:antitoxin HicB